MHQPIAVGKMVNFREDEFYDPDTQKFYSGIWVDVYVSKGAQDTWEKVLDGTLQGFSIGGSINDSSTEFVKDAAGDKGRMVRFVKDYDLVELSLVDSPANKLANIFSITKSADGNTVMTGMIADVKSEQVFYCEQDKVAKTTTDDALMCPEGHNMVSIGWIEYSDADDKTQKVGGVVDNYLSKNNEGGVSEVAEENVEVEPVKVEEPEAVVETPAAEAAEQQTAPDVSEVASVETDLSEKFDSLKTAVEESLEKSKEVASQAVTEALEKFTTEFEELKKGMETKISELGDKHAELSEKVAGLKDSIDKVEKSVGELEGETAVKKSGDLGGSTESELKKSDDGSQIWSGVFLNV
jgi:hypothetical protein